MSCLRFSHVNLLQHALLKTLLLVIVARTILSQEYDNTGAENTEQKSLNVGKTEDYRNLLN